MLRFCVVMLSFFALALAYAAPPDEVQVLRDRAKELVDAQQWKEAESALKKLKGKVPKEEREQVEQMLHRVKGSRDWDKLEKSVKPKTNPRAVLVKIERFRKKYETVPELVPSIEVLHQRMREQIYHVIEDFETDREIDVDVRFVDKPELVKQGKRAGRWTANQREEHYILFACPADWTKYRYVTFWAYSEKKGGRLTIDAFCGGENYFEAWNNIDWVGWKEIRIPFQGKGARFRREGSADWTKVEAMRLWKDEGPPVNIVIDDIRLEKP